MDFQTPKFWGFTLLNNHYQISKYEGKKIFQTISTCLQKLALTYIPVNIG